MRLIESMNVFVERVLDSADEVEKDTEGVSDIDAGVYAYVDDEDDEEPPTLTP